MGFKEDLEAIRKDSEKESGPSIEPHDLWSCLQDCYDHNLGVGCSDQCYKKYPNAAVGPEIKAKIAALMEKHKGEKK
jgi:hypothetical protein